MAELENAKQQIAPAGQQKITREQAQQSPLSVQTVVPVDERKVLLAIIMAGMIFRRESSPQSTVKKANEYVDAIYGGKK